MNEEFLYHRGIEAYIQTLPILNTIGMQDGSEAKYGHGYNVLLVQKRADDGQGTVKKGA